VTFEEADNRLVAGWHGDLPEADALASAQRKRYLRLIYGTACSVNKLRVSCFEPNPPFLMFEECDERLSSGWNVDLHDYDNYCSGQRKRSLKSENERLLSLVRIHKHFGWVANDAFTSS